MHSRGVQPLLMSLSCKGEITFQFMHSRRVQPRDERPRWFPYVTFQFMHSHGVQLHRNSIQFHLIPYFNSCTHMECNQQVRRFTVIFGYFNSCTHMECNNNISKQDTRFLIFQFMHSHGVQPQHLANML